MNDKNKMYKSVPQIKTRKHIASPDKNSDCGLSVVSILGQETCYLRGTLVCSLDASTQGNACYIVASEKQSIESALTEGCFGSFKMVQMPDQELRYGLRPYSYAHCYWVRGIWTYQDFPKVTVNCVNQLALRLHLMKNYLESKVKSSCPIHFNQS